MVCCHICIMNLILFLITSNNLWWYEKIMIGWMIQLENNVFSLNNTWRLQPIIHTWHWVWLILNIIMRSFIDFLLFWWWTTSVKNCWNILAMACNHILVDLSAILNVFILSVTQCCIYIIHICNINFITYSTSISTQTIYGIPFLSFSLVIYKFDKCTNYPSFKSKWIYDKKMKNQYSPKEIIVKRTTKQVY